MKKKIDIKIERWSSSKNIIFDIKRKWIMKKNWFKDWKLLCHFNNAWNVCFLRFDRLADKFAGAPVSTLNIKHYIQLHCVHVVYMNWILIMT